MKVEIEAHSPEVIIIDGKKYAIKKETTKKIGKTIHSDKIVYEELKELEFEKDLDYVVDKLIRQTSTKEILKDLLKHIQPSQIKSIVRKLKQGNKPKKQKGCLGFEIGGRYLEITS